MKNNYNNYANKKILVLGLAKSGMAAATVLNKLGADVVINDASDFKNEPQLNLLSERGVKVITGSHPQNLLEDGFDLIVKNPGIPYNNVIIKEASQKKIPIITEVEIAYKLSEAPFVAVTGTNGKTTTTMLINKILCAGNKNSVVAGNIGQVACEVVQTVNKDQVIVIELSSFQLMGIQTFKPKIAVLTNVSSAHLDYHGNQKNYLDAKLNIFKNQTENDFIVCNNKNIDLLPTNFSLQAQIFSFSLDHVPKEGMITTKNGSIFFEHEEIMRLAELNVPGKHMVENILAAIGVAKLLNVSNRTIVETVRNFTGVEHRLQFVKTLKNRKFYNDSKATNIESAKAALSSFTNEKIILLAGGYDRGIDFFALSESLKMVKTMILFGESANKLAEVATHLNIPHYFVNNMIEAVKVAYRISNEGDIILLSPACASWDQYNSFEERGQKFIEAIERC